MTRRLRRSELATPASSERMCAKAPSAGADLVFLDLEDACAPSAKEAARGTAVAALTGQDWGRTIRAVRINGIDTVWCHDDIIQIVTGAREAIDILIVPKVRSARDVWWVDVLLTQLEEKIDLDKRIGLEVLIEEPAALLDVGEIARASSRLEALIFGAGDFSAAMRARVDANFQPTSRYPGDFWHGARVQILAAARAAGIDAIDAPFPAYQDPDGYRREATEAAALGFDGKWAIHPSQVAIAQEVYGPTEADVDRARSLVETYGAAQAQGVGAIGVDGGLVDAAHLRHAANILDRVDAPADGPCNLVMPVQPLQGVRVLDLGTFIAGPFVGTVLGEFGADILKVERPGVGDDLRRFGTETDCGDTLVWLSEARNKQSVTLNLGDERGRDLLEQLIATADVVIENFRPGVLERWGLGYEAMSEINPRIVLVRISGYGQSGPNRDLPGFARVAHGFSGLAYLAGESGRPPVTPGSTSLADYVSGLYGAIGVLLALRARDQTGRGQCIDLALYESIFRLLDELAPAYQQFGVVRERMGADTVNVVPHGHFQCSDGRWLAIACSNDAMFARLARTMGQPELADPDRFGPKEARLAARPEVNALVSLWLSRFTLDEALARCREGEVPAGPVYSIADIFADPHYAHRGTITTEDSRIGPLAVPNTIPALSDTPGAIRWLGRALGADTEQVLGSLLGLSTDELEKLREDGVI